MKNIIFILCCFCFMESIFAITCTSVGHGSWASPSTWNTGTVPQHNDLVVVAAGHVVWVSNDCNGLINVRVEVYGWLHFNNGRKMSLDNSGVIQVYTNGTITGGNHGSKIDIGHQTKWTGDDPPINYAAFLVANLPGPTPGIMYIDLPIELSYFEARLDNAKVLLGWATESEINNDFFTIQRSKDGMTWEAILDVAGAGNSTELLYYYAEDLNPEFGTSYYRLQQTDYDGTTSVSPIKAVENKMSVAIQIYPNPVSDILVISGEGLDDAQVELTSSAGQRMAAKLSVNRNKIELNVSEMEKGVYFLSLRLGEELKTYPIMVN